MTVAIWSGDSKPSVNEYLLHYVNELKSILPTGIEINSHHIELKFGRILADTPARALLKGAFH